MEGRVAIRADIVDGGRVRARASETVGSAVGTEEIRFGPGFGGDACALGGRFVAGEGVGGEGEFHGGI